MFLTFLTGLTLTDYIAPKLSFYDKYPEITKSIMNLLLVAAVWFIVSLVMPRMIKIKEKK